MMVEVPLSSSPQDLTPLSVLRHLKISKAFLTKPENSYCKLYEKEEDEEELVVECQHLTVLNDSAEGTTICANCGLVLDIFYPQHDEHASTTLEDNVLVTNSVKKPDKVWLEFIRDVCANNPIISGIVGDSLIKYRQLLGDQKLGRFPRKDLAAFAIYTAARHNGGSVSPLHMQSYSGCNMKNLHRLENLCDNTTMTVNEDVPVYYVGRVCSHLNLSGRDQMKLIRVMQQMCGECYGRKPYTVAVAIAYLYCIHYKLDDGGTLTVRSAAQLCNISHVSLKKILQLIKPLTRFE